MAEKVGNDMLYVPMFKSRKYECKILEDYNHYFSETVIPLIEILKDHYKKTSFATDPITGEYLKKRVGKQERRYRIDPTEDDRDTLQYYSNLIASKRAFIDFFRFTTDMYGRQLKTSAIDLSIKINQNENVYKERLLEVSNYPNLIPVLSIKSKFFPQKFEINKFIAELQAGSLQVAIRFDDIAFEKFSPQIYPVLRSEDYIMYDINEQNVRSKEMELSEFNEAETLAQKIVLNSPRKRNIKNSEYENREYTKLIDNSARDVDKIYSNILGFGDYCGMKDVLPRDAVVIQGCALALLYHYGVNEFMAYVNPNREESYRGYSQLIPQIIEDANLLDPSNTCQTIEKIRELELLKKPGTWINWNTFNMVRYLTQMYENR